ncbi:MAG: undecaprenyl-diphosphate phosphatase [Firmicutes bacterium]|nr:undecaprenyl-diphosphate phosphatase [Bacillota bacterium]
MGITLAIFLGFVQGITEFLPVSSSGHLILAQELFSAPQDMMLFNIILHVATLLAVLVVFHKRIWQLVRKPFQKANYCLLLATVITVTFVLLFKDWIDGMFGASVLSVTFMITAVVLVIASFLQDDNRSSKFSPLYRNNGHPTYYSSFFTGLAQGLAVIPGFSRSGFTISAGLATGVSKEKAAEFSFLMSIPIIIAALVYELVSSPIPSNISPAPVIVGFIVALVSGIFAIKFMLHIVKRVKLYWFSLYLIVLSIITLIVL